jgi:hypothetical protein
VVGAGLNGLEILGGAVPLVEDQRDRFDLPGDPLMAIDQLGGQSGESRPIGRVAGVGVTAQRDVEVGRHQQGQADDPQGGAPSLALAPLSECAAVVETVDEGEEIGGVEEDLSNVDLEAGNPVVGQVAFDPLDGLWGDASHVVPEALASQLVGADIQEASQGGVIEPAGHLGLAVRGDTPIQGGDQQGGADRGSGPGLGDVAVDVVDQVQSLGEVRQRHDGAEIGDDRLAGLSRWLGVGLGRSEGGDDVVGATELLLPTIVGLPSTRRHSRA